MALARKTLGMRRNLKEKQRRAQIKEAAINLFSSKGYMQTSMDDLAAEAGVSKSLVYWYWESKAALLSELIDTCMEPYVRLLSEAVESDEPFIDKFYNLIWRYLELSRNSDRLNRLVHFCSLHVSSGTEDNFSEKVNCYYSRVLGLLEKLSKQAVDAGFLPQQADCAALAIVLLSMTEGHIYMSILEDRMPLERIYTSLFSLLMGRPLGKREGGVKDKN